MHKGKVHFKVHLSLIDTIHKYVLYFVTGTISYLFFHPTDLKLLLSKSIFPNLENTNTMISSTNYNALSNKNAVVLDMTF